jgi:hypothetical protein
VSGLLQILNICDKVITITEDDMYAKAKIQQYEDLLNDLDYVGIIGKTEKIAKDKLAKGLYNYINENIENIVS